jgi:hypothetical protein
MSGTAPSRADQDAKAAVAAAQAGIEEFISRLNADDTYYANNGSTPAPGLRRGRQHPGHRGCGRVLLLPAAHDGD